MWKQKDECAANATAFHNGLTEHILLLTLFGKETNLLWQISRFHQKCCCDAESKVILKRQRRLSSSHSFLFLVVSSSYK
jgi:hypothetical protein